MSNKTIKINPDFFSVSNKKGNNKSNAKSIKNKRNKLKEKYNLLNPNKAKKQLLEKIKMHQKNKNKTIIIETDTKDEHSKDIEFNDKLKDSMNYLDNILKSQKKTKEERKQKKQKKQKKRHIDKSIIDKKSEQDVDLVISKTHTDEIPTEQKDKDKQHYIKEPIKINKTIKKHYIKDDPPYGILKGGKKPTFSQYHTLKFNTHPLKNENKIEIKDGGMKLNTPLERKVKLDEIKKKNVPKNRRFKKFKIKTTTKTYKVGKHKHNRSVSIMLKNNVTKKKINQDLISLCKTPIKEVKKYLREKNLIKYTTKTPEYILQSMYINAMLSGDLENVNKSNLIYNYLHKD
jgi:hypothetical protein